MIVLFLWVAWSFFNAFVFGVARTIGFLGSFAISLILSPLAGLIITLCFKTKEQDKREKQMLEMQRQQLVAIKNNSQQGTSLAEQLKILGELKDKGSLSPEEYQKAKNKLVE